MGQKVHPIGIRLGISKNWESRWFSSSSDYSKYVIQDFKIREYLTKKLKDAAVSKIQIDRSSENVTISIFSARPGIVIGKKGEGIESLRREIAKLLDTSINNILLNIKEIKIRNTLMAHIAWSATTRSLVPMARAAADHFITTIQTLGLID